MNGEARPAPNPARIAVMALALAALLGGCADIHRALETSTVNPESPVAATVAAGARLNYPVPLLRDVPPVPKNVPLAPDVKTQVGGLVVCRRAMAGYVLDHPPLSGQAAAFAADERDVVGINPADVPPPDSAAKAEAYAAELRAEAAPPAAINGGPAPTPQEAMPPAPGAPAGVSSASRARTAAPPASAAAPAAAPAAPAAPSAPTIAAAPLAIAPPLPAPLTDPLLARCS